MIVVDPSALVCVVLGEPEAEQMLADLQADTAVVSAATVVKASIIVEVRQDADATRDLNHLIDGAIDEVARFDAAHAAAALDAWRRFGKGRHPAALNFGDCISFATSRVFNAPFLCKGADFSQTDLSLVHF